MTLIAPSLLSADFTNLKADIEKVELAGADMLHLDIMDGHYVPNFTYGHFIVRQIRSITQLALDTHLMVENPEKMVDWFIDAGSDTITFHPEATPNPLALLKKIKKADRKAGLSLKPKIKPEVLLPFLPYIDQILVMSVEPGFGGQGFMESSLKKIKKIKELITDYNIKIEVDGGINAENAGKCIKAGADILVAGTAVFKQKNYAQAIKNLKG